MYVVKKQEESKATGLLSFLLCATIDVAQVKPRAMHVSTEKAIALREKPPFDNIKTIILPIVIYQKEVL
jgi:hypothetical protein